MKEVRAVKEITGKITIGTALALMLLFTLGFSGIALSQEQADKEVCPTPYIKLIKPKLARAGQQITIRGHRFGEQAQVGEVTFSPGIGGTIISWTNSRITVEVPAEAQTGDVVVTNKCGQSDKSMLKIEAETGAEKK
jgi:hypothetical protein